MPHIPYPYIKLRPDRYIFVSDGRRRIVKAVEFVQLEVNNVMNLVFGDLLPDDTLDAGINSNNGDMGQVVLTVVKILMEYTQLNPATQIFIKGSTEVRTRLYERMLRMNYSVFSQEFAINGVIEDDNRILV